MKRAAIAFLCGAAVFAACAAHADTTSTPVQEVAGQAHLVFRADKRAPGVEGLVTVVRRQSAASPTAPLQSASVVSESWRDAAPARPEKRQE